MTLHEKLYETLEEACVSHHCPSLSQTGHAIQGKIAKGWVANRLASQIFSIC